jgi:hypothetical protein
MTTKITLVLAFLFVCPAIHAQCSSIPLTYCGPTDTTVKSGATPSLGAAGTVTVDPDFATKSLRVTASGSCGEAAGENYVTNNGQGWMHAWSSDDTKLLVEASSGIMYYQIINTSSNPISLTGGCVSVSAKCSAPQHWVSFSGATPDKIWCLTSGETTLSSWDTVSAHAVTPIFNVTTIPGFTANAFRECDIDALDHIWACSNGTQESGTQVGVYDISNGNTQVLDFATATSKQNSSAPVALDNLTSSQLAGCGIHEITVGLDGAAIFVVTNGCSSFPTGSGTAEFVWQLGTNHVTYIPNVNYYSSHEAMGFSGVLINSPGNQPPCGSFSIGWKMWPMSGYGTSGSPNFVNVTPCISGIGEQYDDHLSWLNNKNDSNVNKYPFIVMGEKDASPLNHVWPEWELLAVETGPATTLLNAATYGGSATGTIWRLGHTFNDPTNNQCTQMGSQSENVSWSGKYIAYPSDYGGGTGLNGGCTNGHRLDIFVLDATTEGTSPSPPVITTITVASGTVGTPYSQSIAASSGTPPYTFSISAGSLPANLSMNNSGTISGTPTIAATSNFTVTVTDANNQTANQPLSILVNAAVQFDPITSVGGGASLAGGATLQ